MYSLVVVTTSSIGLRLTNRIARKVLVTRA
jgi:hypothetical protein